MEWVVILAGGSGSRFWPLSTPSHPKQLLPLAGPTPTALGAVQAVASIVPRDRILVVTSQALAGPLQRELKLPQANVRPHPIEKAGHVHRAIERRAPQGIGKVCR